MHESSIGEDVLGIMILFAFLSFTLQRHENSWVGSVQGIIRLNLPAMLVWC